MDRRDFLKKGISIAALAAVIGCGEPARPFISTPTVKESRPARANYTPRPIPERLPQTEKRLVLYRREAWTTTTPDARRLAPLERIRRITIHHQGNPSPFTSTDPMVVANELRNIQKDHIRRMGAGDIGYHFIIDPAGNIWEGRSLSNLGAHVRSGNDENLGIMLLGNFNIQDPTPEQLETLNVFLGQQMDTFGVAPNYVFGHRDLAATECPGDRLYAKLRTLPCMTRESRPMSVPALSQTPSSLPQAKPASTQTVRPSSANETGPVRSLF